MSKFKVGDTVRCVDAGSFLELTKGKIYTIEQADGNWVYLYGSYGGWLPDRFELVSEYVEAPQPKPDSGVAALNTVHDAIHPLSSLDRCKVIHAVKALLGMA